MVSHPELSSDPPIGSDRESGCDSTGWELYRAHHTKETMSDFLLIYGSQ